MSFRPLKYLTPVIQPLFRKYFSRTRSFRYKNLRILVKPGVFYPGFIFSTKIFLRYIQLLDLERKTVLELGAGSGIISLFAASKGARVTASDINPVAVGNIRENAARNGLSLTVIESDLFEHIPRTAFDYIFIAPPYYPKDPANFAEMAWYCGRNFEYYERLFQQLTGFSHDTAQILMILSEDCNIPKIKELGLKYGFAFNMVHKKKKMGEWSYIFEIKRKSWTMDDGRRTI